MTIYNFVFKCTTMYTYVVNIYPCIHIEHKYYLYTTIENNYNLSILQIMYISQVSDQFQSKHHIYANNI